MIIAWKFRFYETQKIKKVHTIQKQNKMKSQKICSE